MTRLEAIVLTYLNQVQRTHIDDISHNTNIQLDVLQEIINGLVRLSYVQQETKLDDTPMPRDVICVLFIPSGFYSITSKGIQALLEYNLAQKEKRKDFILNLAKWLIPLIITVVTSVVGWLFFTK